MSNGTVVLDIVLTRAGNGDPQIPNPVEASNSCTTLKWSWAANSDSTQIQSVTFFENEQAKIDNTPVAPPYLDLPGRTGINDSFEIDFIPDEGPSTTQQLIYTLQVLEGPLEFSDPVVGSFDPQLVVDPRT